MISASYTIEIEFQSCRDHRNTRENKELLKESQGNFILKRDRNMDILGEFLKVGKHKSLHIFGLFWTGIQEAC